MTLLKFFLLWKIFLLLRIELRVSSEHRIYRFALLNCRNLLDTVTVTSEEFCELRRFIFAPLGSSLSLHSSLFTLRSFGWIQWRECGECFFWYNRWMVHTRLYNEFRRTYKLTCMFTWLACKKVKKNVRELFDTTKKILFRFFVLVFNQQAYRQQQRLVGNSFALSGFLWL